MNAFEASKRIFTISEELTMYSEKLGQTRKPTERMLIEKKINSLEVEFFRLKHNMEKINIPMVR